MKINGIGMKESRRGKHKRKMVLRRLGWRLWVCACFFLWGILAANREMVMWERAENAANSSSENIGEATGERQEEWSEAVSEGQEEWSEAVNQGQSDWSEIVSEGQEEWEQEMIFYGEIWDIRLTEDSVRMLLAKVRDGEKNSYPDGIVYGMEADCLSEDGKGETGDEVSDTEEDFASLVGKRVSIRGKIRLFDVAANPGQFDARAYYRGEGIGWFAYGDELEWRVLGDGYWYAPFLRLMTKIRIVCSRTVEAYAAEPYSGIYRGIVLGEKEYLSEEVKELFTENGIIHIAAVSGMHLNLAGIGVYRLLRRLRCPRGVCIMCGGFLMVCYVILTGGSVSGIRACVMLSCYLAAQLLGRGYAPFHGLALAVLVILSMQPMALWQAGFLFSLASVLAVHSAHYIAGGETLENRRGRLLRICYQLLPGTLITISTLGISAWFYYEYPIHSILMNLWVIPLVPIIWGSGALSMGAGVLFHCVWLARLLQYPAWAVIWVLLSVCKGLEHISQWMIAHHLGSGLMLCTGQPRQFSIYLYYGLEILFVAVLWYRRERLWDRELVRRIMLVREQEEEYQQGYDNQRQGYDSVKQGYAGFKQEYANQKQGYASRKQEYANQKQEHDSLKQEYVNLQGIENGIRGKKVLYWKQGLLCLIIFLELFAVPFGAYPILRRKQEKALTVTFLDVGQGDCCVITFPDGRVGLIDGGSTSVEEVGKYRIIPYLKYMGYKGRVDFVWLSHKDTDHVLGIAKLTEAGWQIERLFVSYDLWGQENLPFQRSVQVSNEGCLLEGIAHVYYMKEGDYVELAGCRLQCLAPAEVTQESDNDSSMVLYLQYGAFTALFTGDIAGEGAEQYITGKYGEQLSGVDVLKVAHHGSRYSTTEEFLAAFAPSYGVISCGVNSYGHPHEETLERLMGAGVKVLCTEESGAIEIKVEGERITIAGYKSTE